MAVPWPTHTHSPTLFLFRGEYSLEAVVGRVRGAGDAVCQLNRL